MPPIPAELRQRDVPEHPLAFVEPGNIQEDGDLPTDSKRKLVGVDGKWYDVTDFAARHPGGPVIEQFFGQDASQVFNGLGHHGVLKYRKPVGTYKMPVRHPADEDFEKLIKKFKEMGFYTTDWSFYFQKLCLNLSLIALVFYCIAWCEPWYMHYLGGVILAFVWQQCGFFMHELMHIQVFRKHLKDRVAGLFMGTFIFGMSAHWWQDEHIYHHAMTNTVDVASRFVDPQMWELSWAQHPKLFPLFKGVFAWLSIKIQHITFIPFVVFIGRLEILSDSYRVERRWYEWLSIIGHWIWITWLFSHLPTWKEVIITYALAASVEGIFHFQLILSHYCKAFYNVSEFHRNSWYVCQIMTNMNIDTWWWLDWYYGGLNFHIEHHLFPKMARKHLREAGKYVKEVCDKHGIEYDMGSFWYAMTKTLSHLKSVKQHYKLDPR